MQELNNKNNLLDLLAQGATVITPNNRLSGALLQEYFTYCTNGTVNKPACYPYSTTLINAYNQLIFTRPDLSHPILLNETQCQHLWRKIIKSHPEITYSEGLLRAIMEAWEHCQQWQINPENPEFHYTPQTRTFQHWWQLFNKQLKQMNAINEHQLVPYLLNSGCCLFSQTIIWVCFDDFNPQQVTLQHYLNNNGITQFRYDLESREQSSGLFPQVLAARDNAEEYQQLIAWLQSRIAQGEQRIGVVIPNLEQESRSLHRTLLQHFDPRLFNISLGQPLSEFPLVAHALTWLNLGTTSISPLQASLLLQSPYLGYAKEEFPSRSQFLQDSSLLQNQSFSVQNLIQDLQNQVPKLAKLLSRITPYPEQATVQEWIHVFQNRLNSMGYPGDYGLNSENYQCFNRFSGLFDEFRQLNLISDVLEQKEAIESFALLAHNTVFQAQKHNSPVQISGLLEASGCEFDSLWVMGLTDQCLPKKPRLSAFIPPVVQRELQMPHSLPARELSFAKQTLQRFIRGSNETVFSYSKLQGDTPNLPCALIIDFPSYSIVSMPINNLRHLCLVPHTESYLIPILPNENISGGTALLSNQAKCPFKAFAEHRLKAKPQLHTSDGLDAKEKGIIIHKVMELLWRELGSQKELLNLSPIVLEQQIEQAIKSALTNAIQQYSDSFPKLVQDVEILRLKRLVMSVLEWEKQRPEFEIAALEESYTLNLAGLDFAVRVDRLDQVQDSKWVIDYKSSLPSSKPWNEERPSEPQLLLYTLLDKEINTLLLMQLKTGKVLCNGLSENKLDIKGISSLKKDESWEDRRDVWHEQLTHLAEEFKMGHCPPQPANTTFCEQCNFQDLCRHRANAEVV